MPNSAAVSKILPTDHRLPVVYQDQLESVVQVGSGRVLPRIVFEIYQSRRDLQEIFPNPFCYLRTSTRGTFYDWVLRHGIGEYPGLKHFFEFHIERQNCRLRSIGTEQSLSVAIVVPSMNRQERLLPTLRSVAAQSYSNWKLYLVDEEIDPVSRNFASGVIPNEQLQFLTLPKRERGIFEENVARARNFGMRHSSESLIAHLDDDNLWYPDHLRKLIEPFFEDQDLGMAIALHRCTNEVDGRMSDDSGRVSNSLTLYSPAQLKHSNFIASDDVVMRREVLETVGFIREDMPYYADWDYWLRISATVPVQQIYEMLTDYMIHEGSITERLGNADFKLKCENQVRRAAKLLSDY